MLRVEGREEEEDQEHDQEERGCPQVFMASRHEGMTSRVATGRSVRPNIRGLHDGRFVQRIFFFVFFTFF